MTTMVSSKSIFQSKTFWINFLTFIVALLTSLMGTDWIQSHPDTVAIFVMVLNILNIGMRFLTDKPVSTFGKDVKRVDN